MSIRDFIESNRQTGSTTWIAEATIASDGYMIVGTILIKEQVLREHPRLRKDQVFAISEINSGRTLGLSGNKTIFIDTTVALKLRE